MKLESISLEGGGGNGFAYLGMLQAFEELSIYDGYRYNIDKIYGTSVGALIGYIIALDISPTTVIDTFTTLKESDIFDIPIPKQINLQAISSMLIELLKEGAGLNTHDKIKKIIKKLTLESPHESIVTFKDLYETTGHDLHIYCTNLSRIEIVDYCYKNTPNIDVVQALLGSMSIPFVFKHSKLSNGDVILDGGLLYNIPTIDEDSIIFLIHNMYRKKFKITSLLDAIKAIFTLYYVRDYVQVQSENKIFLDTTGMSLFNFEYNDNMKTAIENSKLATINFLV